MQSLPVSPLQVLTQKLKLHFIINGVVSLVPSVVLSIMLGMKPVNVIITILIPIIFSLFSGLLGLMFDLKKPKLDWNTTAEAVNRVQVLCFRYCFQSLPCVYLLLRIRFFSALKLKFRLKFSSPAQHFILSSSAFRFGFGLRIKAQRFLQIFKTEYQN